MNNPPDGSLVQDLNNYLVDSPAIMNPQGHVVRHFTRLTDFGDYWVRLERPLPVNVSTDWTPEV